MAAKKKDKVKVTFVGTNATEVTGSCTHVQAGNKQYLLECGMYQSVRSLWENYQINTKKYKFKAKEIDGIFVSHVHADHMGLIPMLYAHHCTAPIYIPEGNFDIFKIILEDSAFINIRDAELLSQQKGKNYPPVFTQEDVKKCLDYVQEIPFDEEIQVDEQTTLTYKSSGHILNAAQMLIKTTVGNATKTIAYTGDLGNITTPNHYSGVFSPIKKADLFIGETTYANSPNSLSKKDRKKDLEKIESIINQVCLDEHGKVLIPCFASSRTQNMITCLYDIFGEKEDFNIPVLIDSPMACKITKLYRTLLKGEDLEHYKKVLSWKNLVFVETVEDSRAWRESDTPCIVCSASGMLTAGRSVGWLGKILPHGYNHIIFVGYIPTEGGIGIKIKNGLCKTLTVSGKRVANKCGITSLKSFTSHMQYNDLLNYYSKVKAPKIALVHGEQKAKTEFAKVLQDKISKNNSTNRVIATNKETSITI